MIVQRSFNETLEEIQTIIAPISYSQKNILERESVFTKDPNNGFYRISNFYRNSDSLDFGTCGELTNALYKKLQSVKEIKTLIVCNGWDGGQNGIIGEFSGKEDTHMFLIASPESDIIEPDKTIKIDDSVTPSQIFDSAYIIDPSFNRIQSYTKSGYSLKKIRKGLMEYKNGPEDVILREMEEDLPILRTEKGEIWGLIYAGEHDLCLTRPDRYDNIEFDTGTFFSLSRPDPQLEGKANRSKTLYWFVKKLREKVKNAKFTNITSLDYLSK
jgi:hypothetical protein